ncbi:uncharacterized protein TNCT_329081 [Trichonephila clavata]|uniref:Amiloride-sensitive sodium channel n=1 Tax=Trichonephila clavata TaxID=2740835 RepID=A0A8X6HVY9_TRICU|nr:uncharacterized protein TNCT_329081 [Trichonephila clavata]
MGAVDDDKLVFDAEEKEVFYPHSKPGILFAIHSPFEAVDPFKEGIFMKPGHLYRIKLEMMREELLPHPYKTDCLNYTEKWLKAGRTGPRSQEMCRQKCLRDLFENCYNCTLIEILYPKKTRICNKTLDEYDEISCPEANLFENLVSMKSCYENCKDDCSRAKFSYRVQESCITQKMMFNSTRIPSHIIKVKVYFDDTEILTMRYKPQYQHQDL